MTAKLTKIARTTGLVGVGVTLVSGGVSGLLLGEAKLARRKVEERTPVEDPPSGNGIWGKYPGEPIRMVILGDSSAVGLGGDDAAETPGVMLANALSQLARRPVKFTRLAVSGSESKDLAVQVDDALPLDPDIAIIMIGANDVTSRNRVSVSVRFLADAVRRLQHEGVEVVVGTCPDLGTVRPIPQPLRLLARRWSRQLAAAQIVGVVEAGGRTVSLGGILGPLFASHRELWSDDEFHPSAAGYAAAASVMLPSAADALGYWPISRESIRSRVQVHDQTKPIEHAAARASHRPGSEVTPVDKRIESRNPRGPLAVLRKFLPMPMPAAQITEVPAIAADGVHAGEVQSAVDQG